ncbi:MAG TPA: thermonuclease family protein [Pyrinomonadaceae bacterium]|nr:thermonuclease family protein [Pyrinomonadaceae bacterium]
MKSMIFLFAVFFPVFVAAQIKIDSSLTFPYEKQCGRAGMESNFWADVNGRVTRVKVSDSISVFFDDGKQKKVILAGIAPFTDKKDEIRQMLIKSLLGQQIRIQVQPGKMDKKEFVGVIFLKDNDVSQKLIESGKARYKNPSDNEMTSYQACTYLVVEQEAQKARRGFWTAER